MDVLTSPFEATDMFSILKPSKKPMKPTGGMGGQVELTSFRAGVKTEVQG